MLADVGCRAAVHRRACLEEGWGVRPLGATGKDEVGAVACAYDGGQLGQVRPGRSPAHQGDLLGRGEAEVEGPEEVPEGLGVLGCGFGEEAEDGFGLLFVGAVACQGREA